MKYKIKQIIGLTLAAASLSACNSSNSTSEAELSNEFWLGPISTERLADSVDTFDGRNFNFPEESATYWLARINIPEGASLSIKGEYPHARYLSLNSYREGGVPADARADVLIQPDAGSSNPFLPGADRNTPQRNWTLRVIEGERPEDPATREPNVLFTGDTGDRPVELLLRVYEPDNGQDLTGGVGLPIPELTLADNSVLTGADAVGTAINSEDRTLDSTVIRIELDTYRQLVNLEGSDPATSPAFNPIQWERSFNARANANAYFQAAGRDRPFPEQPDEGSFYSNDDARYIFTYLNRQFGKLAVIRGRMPTFPTTFDGEDTMTASQVRFWSLCSGESRLTTRTPDCVADRAVPLDENRDYTIVVSRAEDRPANARPECGVAWLDLGENGDADLRRENYGLLIMRNMYAAPDFANAIQRISAFGEEQSVMGPYFPQSEYSSKEDFEALGCN